MPQSSVYQSVAAEAQGRKNYDPLVHSRVDALVQEYIDSAYGDHMPYASSDEAFVGEVEDCTDWVKREYRQRYGNPVIAWLLMTILSGFISWLVQRTLEKKFPRNSSAYPSTNIVG